MVDTPGVGSPFPHIGETFELELPTIRLEVELAREGEFRFKLGEHATDLEMFVGALVRLLPGYIPRRFAKRKWEREIMVLFDRIAEG
ncbi:MAG: hypothetical protein WHT46_07655 [Candidatus Geothermincolales bacterium]